MRIKVGTKFISLNRNESNTVYGSYKTDSIQIEKELGVRSTCNATLWHIDPSIRYQKGLPYEIYDDDNNLILAGFIEKPKYHREGRSFYHDIEGIDYRYLADKRIVIYSKLNASVGTIARELFDNYLAAEGCTIGEIQAGPVVSETVFNYIHLNRALDSLADNVGFFWKIDNQKRFYFVDRATYEAPWALTFRDVNGTPQIENGNLSYRNTQYILDAKNITIPLPVIHEGDGNNRSFLVDFPIAVKPSIEVSISGGGYTPISASDVGIRGVDKNKKWYWNKADKVVSQDGSETVLNADDFVKITYQGFENIVTKVSDSIGISAMQSVEGFGSGIVEEALKRSDLESTAATYEAANYELEKNAQIGDRITFLTRRAGLEPGQMLPIDLPRYNLNDSFLIEKVIIREEKKGLVWYTVTASKGVMYESWTKMFTKMFFANEPLVIRENISENEFLRLVSNFSKIWDEEERPNIFNEFILSDDIALSDDMPLMFDYSDRVKYVEAYDGDNNFLGRKPITSQTGQTGSNIFSRSSVMNDEFNGQIETLVWYGGYWADNTQNSGIEIDRQSYSHLKTVLEALQIQRTDVKGW